MPHKNIIKIVGTYADFKEIMSCGTFNKPYNKKSHLYDHPNRRNIG